MLAGTRQSAIHGGIVAVAAQMPPELLALMPTASVEAVERGRSAAFFVGRRLPMRLAASSSVFVGVVQEDSWLYGSN